MYKMYLILLCLTALCRYYLFTAWKSVATMHWANLLALFFQQLLFTFCLCRILLCVKSPQSCLTLCDTMDYNLPGSFVHAILQARILLWIAMVFSRGSSWPRDWTQVFCIAGRFFTIWAPRGPLHILLNLTIFHTLHWQKDYDSLKALMMVKSVLFFFVLAIMYFLNYAIYIF